MAGTFTYAYPGLQIECTRDEVFAVKIDTAISNFETRTRWNATPQYVYKLKIIGRKAAPGPVDEVAAIVAFYESQYGEWDSFSFTDPADGTVRTCRFSGPLKMKRVMPSSSHGAWWEMDVELRTVTNPS